MVFNNLYEVNILESMFSASQPEPRRVDVHASPNVHVPTPPLHTDDAPSSHLPRPNYRATPNYRQSKYRLGLEQLEQPLPAGVVVLMVELRQPFQQVRVVEHKLPDVRYSPQTTARQL